MAYKVIILYRLYMPSYFLGTFTEYPEKTFRIYQNEGCRKEISHLPPAPFIYFINLSNPITTDDLLPYPGIPRSA